MLKRKRDAGSSATLGHDSSSSSFPSSGWDYEVFLSFRGPDTRKTFTDHLYNALVSRGIRTFRDDEELRIGEEIDQALRSAIHQSKIAIPIFSKGYAWSKWCLRELAEIVGCMKQKGQRQITVLPVFYHVDPSDVRYQIGCYEEAFRKHEKRYAQETEGWKKALKEAADLKGWDVKKIADGHEAELIKLIVKEVWSELRESLLIVSGDLVGIDSHVEEMKKLLKIESNDQRIVVGIHGLGGIGKTTIARCVYNAVYHDFDGCSFIADARETCRMRGLVHLQSQLIGNILNMENLNIASVDEGIHIIRQRLSSKRVLIVFDDVDFDINAIIGKHNRFGFGSRIIITTRDRHILDVFGVDKLYEPMEMNFSQSLQLFSRHAFKRDHPPEQYLALSKEVVKTTGGLPLALEVIGSSLFCTEESAWKNMVKKLKSIPNDTVQMKLRISYDGLDRVQKEMFLDIACFFIGMDKDIACYIWDGFELDVLCRKSLIKIDEFNELRMHDQLRDLGREIVCQENPKEPGERSRLWSEEAVMDVLSTQTGTRKVEGLCVKFPQRDPPSLISEGFAAMTNLRLLQLDHAVVSGNFMHSFSELRWLSWTECRNLQFTLTNPRKLAVLDLSFGNITESWRGWSYIKVAETLKVLDLRGSDNLSQTPNLSANLKLEVLILEACFNLATIDDSIGHLKSLVVLNMKDCSNLKNLPTSICELRSLKRLDISYTKISQLPENLGCLEALTELLMDRTSIERLPNSIGHLKKLKTLSVGGCNIQEGGIPDVIGRLSSLEILSLRGNQFHSLPATVSSLSLLQKLSLESCDKLQSLPQLSNLTNLETLCFGSCKNLMELPITMDGLTRLESLSLTTPAACQYVSHLPSGLRFLTIQDCENVREISAFREMRNLKTLKLLNCPMLAKIEILEGLDSMQQFVIHGCNSLSKLPNLRGLKKLRYLSFINVGIAEIEGLEGLYSLKDLFIDTCHLLRKIPKLSDLKNIVGIQVKWCNELSEIEGIEGLDSLEELNLDGCLSLRKILLPKNLRKVRWSGCDELSKIEGVEGLEFLEELDLINCQSLRKIQLPKKVPKLYIESKLTEIEGLEDMESLEEIRIRDSPSVFPHVSTWKNLKYLDISRCDWLERLPDLSSLKKLNNLWIEECGKLIEVPSVDRLESLEELRVRRCESLEILPDLSNLTKLRTLIIQGCGKLTEIQGVDRLEILEILSINWCISIETLPCLSNLKKLRTVSAIDCKKLTEIQGVDELEALELLNVRGCLSMKLPDPSSLRKLQRFIDPNSGDTRYDNRLTNRIQIIYP